MLGISIDTARRAIKANRLKAFRLHDRGHYRVSMREIDQFMKDNDHAHSSAF
ncbi:MAG: helix-turn-helix domain-containing protein [Verrucomicrobia bacterium]|nr:helix-turn-helix domain-containing protein [Verrucomicrobiota bacterium]